MCNLVFGFVLVLVVAFFPQVLGDCCLCSFVFYSGECLVLTFLILRWHENSFKYVR